MASQPLAARRPEIVLAVLLSGCLILLSLQVRTADGRSVGERWLLNAVAPLVWVTTQGQAGFRDLREWGATHGALVRQNRALGEQVRRLEAEVLRLRDADRERKRLLELLGSHPSPPVGTRAARLIAIDSAGPFRSGLLDAGAADGLKAGGVVVSPAGLLGRIVAVGAATSRVQLLSDRTAAVGVVITRSGRVAVARGDGAGGVSVYYVPVPAQTDVAAEDAVVTSGTDGLYPKDLPVGRVAVLKRSSHSLFLELPVVLAADPNRESLVFVLPPVLPPDEGAGAPGTR